MSGLESPRDPDMEALHRQVLDRRSLSFATDDQLPRYSTYLRALKASLLDSEDYLEARSVQDLITRCNSEQRSRANQAATAIATEQAGRIIAEKQQAIDQLQQQIDEHDNTTASRLAEIEDQHREALAALEQKWTTDMPDRYRRPSKDLIQTRLTYQSLATSGHFEEAAARKAEAASMANREQKAAQRRLNADYRSARAELLGRQEVAIRQFIENSDAHRQRLVRKRQVLKEGLSKRNELLKSKPPQKLRAKTAAGTAVATPRRPRKEVAQRLGPLNPPKPARGGSGLHA
jgi:hypothetical protein